MRGRERPVSRRVFIRGATGGVLAGVALPSLLAACAPAAPAQPTAAPAKRAGTPTAATQVGAPTPPPKPAPAATSVPTPAPATALPSFVPLATKPKADLPSSGPLYQDAYLNYPASPFKAQPDDPPGTGSTITSFVQALFPPYTPIEQNRAWQAVNKALNVNFQFNLVPTADYLARLGTLMASPASDLPDIVNFFRGLNAAPNAGPFLQRNMADLTPYLGGDAIKEYPNLAAIPTRTWKNSGSVIEGRLYMVPIERPAPGTEQLYKNSSIYDKEIGADYVPKNAADYKRVLLALTQPANNTWGTASYTGWAYHTSFYIQLFGAPLNWQLDATGKLVKDIETPQYKEAVGYVRDLVASGVMHPDSPTIASQPAYRDAFIAGKFAIAIQAFGANWFDVWSRGLRANPPVSFLMLPPFAAFDGGKPVTHLGPGYNTAAALKPASPERIKEILRVLNWLAAPFGSQEDLLLTYGLSDAHHNLDAAGNPIPTQAWNADVNNLPFRYTIQRPQVIYYGGAPDFVRLSHEAERALVPHGISDPTWGFYSPTFNSKGVTLTREVQTFLDDMTAGRRPLSDYDEMVKTWQANGGDQMRREYQDAITAAR